MRLGAVILAFSEHDAYRGILDDLLEQGLAPAALCVVHNPLSPQDRDVEVPEAATVLRMPRNLGYAGGMNAGLAHHLQRGAEWVWLLTHDVRLRPGALAAMRSAAERAAGYAALGPVLFEAGSDTVFALGGERTALGVPYNAGYGTRLAEPPSPELRPCAWLDGSAVMLRAAAVREVGALDASLFLYAEDALYCLRLERAGWSIGVVTEAAAAQSSGRASRPGPVAFLQARNGLVYAQAWRGSTGVALALARRLRDTAHLVRVACTGPDRRVALAEAAGLWAGVLAFAAGRRGPAPNWLPGRGDLRRR